jgi:hypothetical protein
MQLIMAGNNTEGLRYGTTRNIKARRIWLNLELAKKPPRALEYIVVHELNHLQEKGTTSASEA